MRQYKMKCVLGEIYIVASEEALLGIYWKAMDLPFIKHLKESAFIARVVRQVEEYLEGKRSRFDLAYVCKGTEFQEKVWKELGRIPYGQTISYSELARRVGSPKAVRAVGTANGRNPISLIVPCHRVIAAGGGLGGYAGGLERKRLLLDLERGRRGRV